jgi:hypothetical protein
LRRSAQGTWTETGSPRRLNEVVSTNWDVAVEPIPCRDEWLVVTSGRALSTLAKAVRLGLNNQLLGNDIELPNQGVTGIGGSQVDCSARDPEMLVARLHTGSSTPSTSLTRIRVNRSTGTLSVISGAQFSMNGYLTNAHLLHWGGRWLFAGSLREGSDVREPYLGELDVAGANARRIALFETGGPTPGAAAPFWGQNVGLTFGGAALLVTFPKGEQQNLDEHYQLLNPSTSGEPAAITYTIGCP